MRRVKAALLVVESSQSSVSWEYETLLQRLMDLKNERDELQKNLRASMYDVKQKSAFRGMLLEKKLVAMNRLQEEREAQLNEVLARANLEPSVLGQIKGHVDDEYGLTIAELGYEPVKPGDNNNKPMQSSLKRSKSQTLSSTGPARESEPYR
eukprot:gene27392-36161_t